MIIMASFDTRELSFILQLEMQYCIIYIFSCIYKNNTAK